MTETVRVWLVERDFGHRDLVTLVYATPDGERRLIKEMSTTALGQRPTTAAREVDPDRLSPVDETDRERYATEVQRVREEYGPDEEI